MADDDDDDDDHRKAAYLRFQFHGYCTATSIWTHLQNAGWKYKSGDGYRAPSELKFCSANETLQKLNQAAIVPLDNYLQLPPDIPDVNEQSEALRKNLIDAIPAVELTKETGDGETAAATITTTASIAPPKTTGHDASSSSSRRQHLDRKYKGRSATTFDAGADLFLKQSKTKKKRKKGQFLLSGGGVKQSNDAALEFPTPIQIAEVYDGVTESAIFQKKEEEHSQHYDDWKFLLCTNHSLLFYGFGSKQNLLNDFWKTTLKSVGDVLVIDAFDRSVALKDVLSLMVSLYLDDKEPLSDSINVPIAKRAELIGKAISRVQLAKNQPLYLVIHNIDGFRKPDDQHALSVLLSHSNDGVRDKDVRTIRLIASVDHVNSSASLWGPETSATIAFTWQKVDTFRPYIEELKRGMENLKGRQSKRLKSLANVATSESIFEILNTIAQKHTEVLKTLVHLQLDSKGAAVSYEKFLKTCTDKIIVTTDSNLRKFLTELLDHGIVEMNRQGGREYLLIPHSSARLHEILKFDVD